MSRAFVKEDANQNAKRVLPDKPLSPHPNYVTPRGLRLLRDAHAEQTRALEALRGQTGDAVEHQRAQIERELRYLQARLKSAILVAPNADGAAPQSEQDTTAVRFGARVATVDENGQERVFRIVGEDEADVTQGYVAWVSPLARALTGQAPGDMVVWKRPAGDMELEIVSVDYPFADATST